jgi:phage tail tape-measure protein
MKMRYGDLIELEIKKLITETENQIPKVPADLDRNYEASGGWAGFAAGAALGAKVGAGLGIAGGPLGAIAGTFPGAIVGGIIGYFGGAKVGERISAEDK